LGFGSAIRIDGRPAFGHVSSIMPSGEAKLSDEKQWLAD
jgi:hypothetical protein